MLYLACVWILNHKVSYIIIHVYNNVSIFNMQMTERMKMLPGKGIATIHNCVLYMIFLVVPP